LAGLHAEQLLAFAVMAEAGKGAEFEGRLREAEARAAALEERMADASLAGRATGPAELAAAGRELAALRPLIAAGSSWREAQRGIAEARELLRDGDPQVQALAREEVGALTARLDALEGEMRALLAPRDESDARAAVLEIRAGTGGDEAALFAADLFRMYGRYAESRGWKIEPLSEHATSGGGFKEVIAILRGPGVFGQLKHERGVHRVQRVPETESQGRIHTSTVTVAIMPEADEVDIAVEPGDLQVDVFRASGPGGQSVNTTDSAVRITHRPTGVVVTCQDEKSQHKNKAKAMKVLRARLLQEETERRNRERADLRRNQVGSGERSEKIRTYNFPQNRVTDHRAGITLHKLDRVIAGDLAQLLDAVNAWQLREQGAP